MDRLVLKGSSRSCCQCLEKRKASANQVSLLERMMLCICVFPCIYELYKMGKGTFHWPCGPVVPKSSTWQTPRSHGWHPTFIPHFRDHHFGGPGIAPETFQHRWLKPSHIISAVLTQCIAQSKLEKMKKSADISESTCWPALTGLLVQADTLRDLELEDGDTVVVVPPKAPWTDMECWWVVALDQTIQY